MKIKKIDIGIYDFTVKILLDDDPDKMCSLISTMYPEFQELDWDTQWFARTFGPYAGDCMLEDFQNVVVIALTDSWNPGLIAHEAYHATDKILEYCGINDKEAFAYLLEWIVTKTYFKLNKKKAPV